MIIMISVNFYATHFNELKYFFVFFLFISPLLIHSSYLYFGCCRTICHLCNHMECVSVHFVFSVSLLSTTKQSANKRKRGKGRGTRRKMKYYKTKPQLKISKIYSVDYFVLLFFYSCWSFVDSGYFNVKVHTDWKINETR